MKLNVGQARKSLWIETNLPVKLVVSKTVRLVRACGSKHFHNLKFDGNFWGQARKSLWIETVKRIGESFGTKRSGS